MKFLDLSTDVLAVKCINNYVFVGVGCFLYVINKIDFKIIHKINALHPDNIHGILVKSSDKLVVFGGKSLCIFHFEIDDNILNIKKIDDVHRFNDWIISINCLESTNDSQLLILFAHNYVYNYDFQKMKYSDIFCKEACLLYAGMVFGGSYENAIVFSGTVFQEVLVWKINDKNKKHSEVLHRLKGHKGVIFSVLYDPSNNIICSTSDDRTVRLWKISNKFIHDQITMDWENVEISLDITMYGHLARVWKAIIFKNIIISIGEDSRICFWNLLGDLLHKIEAHRGAPIWCIDISENEIIYTGGADGFVNCWSLSRINNFMKNNVLLEYNKDIVPKYVTFLHNSDILVYANSNNCNNLLHYDHNDYQLINSYNLSDYSSSYCVIEISLNKQILALGSIKGDIRLYKNVQNVWKQYRSHKIANTKIFSLQWLDTDIILICAADGIIYIIELLESEIKIISEHILPSSRERWVTSACKYNNILICGDRMGSVFVYKLGNSEKDPIQVFKKIHGRLGVQSCTIVKSNLITTGRDGTLRFYKFNDEKHDNRVIEFLYAKNIPMDWVCKLLSHQKDFYVLGFKEDDFVIYHILLDRILTKITCGGGHRSWDCVIHDKFLKFIYIQKRQVYHVRVSLDTLFIPPLLTGYHTKEIYCGEILPTLSNDYAIFLSGGEDCTLHVNYINFITSEEELNLKEINILNGHLSSIRCLSIYNHIVDEDWIKYIIFSGGGRAQLKVWEISIKTNENMFSKDNISCKDLLSYMLHGPDKERNKIWVGKELMYNADPETRFMGLSIIKDPRDKNSIFVFVACSDGFLRTLNYDICLNKLTLIHTLAYRNRCILKIHSFVCNDKILLMTLATDGLLNFWNFSFSNDVIQIEKLFIDEKDEYNLHQSGINSFDMKLINKCEYILATGGDDNLLNLLSFKILSRENILSIRIISSWKTSCIHYAQITGVKLLNDGRLISVGADQKLAIHKYVYSASELEVKLLEEISLSIPDIQGIAFLESCESSKNLFFIYGKGLQLIEN